jgi:hypothetical protein
MRHGAITLCSNRTCGKKSLRSRASSSSICGSPGRFSFRIQRGGSLFSTALTVRNVGDNSNGVRIDFLSIPFLSVKTPV